MLHMLLVFGHMLAASMALGAIVATDLRLLSKLSQDKVRIAPPNEFVARIVMVALLLLYVTGGAIVWVGLGVRPDYLENPKLQAKIGLVIVLTLNAFVLHKLTFPRLARGRRVARWRLSDWIVIAVPVGTSNFLWMFVAFLGIARPWNFEMPLRDILEIAAALYLVAQVGVLTILATAARRVEPNRPDGWADKLARSLAAVGSLGRSDLVAEAGKSSSRRRRSRDQAAAAAQPAASLPAATSVPPAGEPPLAAPRPALRLVGTRSAASTARRAAR
ncbi:MAG: hypothetical protein ABI699_03515 [Caldimonas sp.]